MIGIAAVISKNRSGTAHGSRALLAIAALIAARSVRGARGAALHRRGDVAD